MILAECVLVYMDPDKSRDVVNWFGQHFSTALFLNYEPVCVYVCTILPSSRLSEKSDTNIFFSYPFPILISFGKC